tara:strand:+ start:337 stop:600 length:264 start_codon:yes stop_codon:yes gene_type:complete
MTQLSLFGTDPHEQKAMEYVVWLKSFEPTIESAMKAKPGMLSSEFRCQIGGGFGPIEAWGKLKSDEVGIKIGEEYRVFNLRELWGKY